MTMGPRLFLALIVALTALVGCERPKDVAPAAPPPFPPAKLPAYEPITVSPGALAGVKSAQGSVVSLTEIDTDIVTDPEFRVVWPGLLSNRAMIGVRQTDGDYVFCPVDGVDEYYNDGETASISLVSGDKLEGQPILARVFGKSATGEVSIGGPQINLIKFSTGEIGKRNASLKFKPTNWWEGWKQNVDVTMSNQTVRPLENIAVVGFYTGCDQMWIPCKPFTTYNRYRNLLVKNGDFRMELKLEDIAQLEITSINAAQGGNQDSANGIAVLRNGERLNFTTWSTTASSSDGKENNWVPLGFMGMDEKGMIHAFKFKSVKSIAFK